MNFNLLQSLGLVDGGFINLMTPAEEFFVLNKYKGPKIDLNDWRLKVGGLVHKSVETKFKDLSKSFSERTESATLECVINKEGGDLVGNGLWTGIPLSEVLEEAKIKDVAVEVLLSSYDGKTSSISLEEALKPQTLLAYLLNGKPLREDHGFPLRLVVPGCWGFRWIKWMKTIDVIGYEYTSESERNGWSELDNRMLLTTKIMKPKDGEKISKCPIVVAGASWDGGNRIRNVEISIDGGATWDKAELTWIPKTPLSWTVWTYVWTPEKDGVYSIMAKATNELGITEPVNRDLLEEVGMSGTRKLSKISVTVIP